MRDLPNGHPNIAVDRLRTLLEAELAHPTHATPELRNIFLNLQHTDSMSETIDQLRSSECEILELLLQNCDSGKNKGLWKIFYPLIYSWVEWNTAESLELVSNLIPTLIWQYLSSIGSGEPEEEAEACLVRLTNTLAERSGFSFRLPSIHMISIYHYPAKMQYTGGLTEASLTKGFNMEPVYTERSGTNYETLSSFNRLSVLTLLLEKYNQNIGDALECSLQRFCWLVMWICGSGMPAFPQLSDNLSCWDVCNTRFTLDKDLLTALLAGLQHCLYNGHCAAAQRALEVVIVRAEYDVFPEVMMMASALRDTIRISPVSPAVKPFGIQMPQLQGTINETRRPIRNSFVRHEDVQLFRQRMSSSELREDDEGGSPASVIIDCTDSDESDIHIANFRDGKLQNSSC